MMKAGLMYNGEAAAIHTTLNVHLSGNYNYVPGFMDALMSVPNVFLFGGTKYNNALWTMRTELLGSYYIIIILLALHFSKTNKKAIFWILTTFIFFFSQSQIAFFNFGLLIAFFYANEDFIGKLRRNTPIKIAVVAAVIVVYGLDIALAQILPVYAKYILKPLAAGLIVASLTFIKPLNWFFSSKVSRFLGKISFPLYVIHTAVICSFTSYLMLQHPDFRDNLWTALVIYAASVLASLIAACCFYPVEKLSIWFSRKLFGFVVE
jgi:peptidoglycan/LPS O-acetylase OafA/YrhL